MLLNSIYYFGGGPAPVVDTAVRMHLPLSGASVPISPVRALPAPLYGVRGIAISETEIFLCMGHL